MFLSQIFNGAVRLAFTASSEFDNEKAVYNSHKHEIYHKPLAEAVKDGELAAYIQTQFHIVRAEPSQKLKDKFDGEINGEAKRKVRQEAWTKWAVRYYREGRDRKTEDLVSDNQAGFFVDDISHANKLEKTLNADEALATLAKNRNCKAVAAAIHSKMPKKEQERRLDDYKAGKYMAIIGDEMLKEGFDHESMKTVIDWPHGSLVDKVQILGRGARKWFNTSKDRFEGLVFADTIVYIGSDDPEIDKSNRAQALRNAILASDVLEDIHVFAPDEDDKPRQGGREGGGYSPPFEDDLDVEEYTTLEAIKTLLGERSKLRREHLIPITRKMRQTLNDHIERTGVGSEVLLAGIDNPPESLTRGKIYSWRHEVNTVEPDEWNLVMGAYETLPDRKMIGITKAMRASLNGHVERTKIGAKTLCKIDGIPEGFNANKHYLWCTTAKKAPEDEWKAIIGIYEILKTSLKKKSDPTTPITQAMRDELEQELKRTQLSYAHLEKVEGKPQTLNKEKIKEWLGGRVQHCDINEYNWALSYCKALPSMVVIDNDKKSTLRDLAEGTEIKRLNALLIAHPSKPKDLDNTSIRNAFNLGYSNSKLLKIHHEWLLSTLRELVSETKLKKQNTPEPTLETIFNLNAEDNDKRAALDQEIVRTLVKGSFVASHIKKNYDCPEGLTEHMVKNVLDGKTDIIRENHYEFLLKVFAELPTKIRLTDANIALLNDKKDKTGVSFAKVIKQAQLESLKIGTVNNWSSGKSRIAEKALWDQFITTYDKIEKAMNFSEVIEAKIF